MKTIKLFLLLTFFSISLGISSQTVVQAENYTANLNGSTATTDTGYKGTGYALMTDASKNYLEWNNVTVSTAGYYSLKLRYQNKSVEVQSCVVSVNNTEIRSLSFPKTRAWTYGREYTIYLVAGENTLRLAIDNTINNTSPLLDEMTLTQLTGAIYQAENRTAASGVEETNHLNYTGTGFHNVAATQGQQNGQFIEFSDVFVPFATSKASLIIRYALSDLAGRPCDLYVNNTFSEKLAFKHTGWWDDWKEQTTTVDITLNAGLNTLKFVVNNDIGKGPNLDKFELIMPAPNAVQNTKEEKIDLIVNNQDQIVVRGCEGNDYSVFNLIGKQIERGVVRSNNFTLNSELNAGVYIVKVGNKSQRLFVN